MLESEISEQSSKFDELKSEIKMVLLNFQRLNNSRKILLISKHNNNRISKQVLTIKHLHATLDEIVSFNANVANLLMRLEAFKKTQMQPHATELLKVSLITNIGTTNVIYFGPT